VNFEHRGVALAYDDSGERGLPPVVLLHGLSSARTTWRDVARRLAGRYRLFALDQRGHGDSAHAPGNYLLEHYGADTIAFCESVVREPAALVGHSLGGVIAAYVAQQRPELVRCVFLEDPPLYRRDAAALRTSRVASFFPAMREMLRELRKRRAALAEYEALVRSAPALNGVGTMADVLGEAGARAQAAAWAGCDPEIFTPAIEGVALAASRPELPLLCPVAVVRGDPALGAAFTSEDAVQFALASPHAAIALFEATSHAVHDERPERFAAELEAFLAQNAAP
jgi:pimeloyl-ACP methyl ester carboxylesterase